MADQHNANIPALTNQVAADIPDIKENLEFHKDAFQILFETWSDTDNSSNVIDSALGFSDGTYTYDFPTNGVAGNSVIMLGNSSTVLWMYLNTAPPGWKALSTGADMVLGIAGGSSDYNVNGGNPDTTNTWTIDGLSSAADATAGGTHAHKWYDSKGANADDTSGAGQGFDTGSNKGGSYSHFAVSVSTGDTYPDEDMNTDTVANHSHSHSHTVSQDASWRPKASVGKLFQLDTA